MEKYGLILPDLIAKLIDLAKERYEDKRKINIKLIIRVLVMINVTLEQIKTG